MWERFGRREFSVLIKTIQLRPLPAAVWETASGGEELEAGGGRGGEGKI